MVNDINTSASDLNEDFEKKGNWAFQWNMNFNPDPKRSFFKNTRLETLNQDAGLENYIYFIIYFIVNHLVTFSI